MYTFIFVEFEAGGKTYAYLSNGDDVAVGDYVKVPSGGREAVVRVVDVVNCTAEDAPFPVDKAKTIIEKYTIVNRDSNNIDAEELKHDLHGAILQLIDFVDEEQYPETFGALEHMMGLPLSELEPMLVANTLLQSDEDSKMQTQVAQFTASLYKLEIENENPSAYMQLGNMYEYGRGTDVDHNMAIHYYKGAAELGLGDADEILGYEYYYGKNVDVDDKLAYKYFSMGALVGNASCIYKMGDMYQNGRYVEKNMNQAFQTYLFAHSMLNENNEKDCAGPIFLRLGDAFFYGWGTKPDMKEALVTYQRAEQFLIEMVSAGDMRYIPSFKRAVEGHKRVTQILLDTIDNPNND